MNLSTTVYNQLTIDPERNMNVYSEFPGNPTVINSRAFSIADLTTQLQYQEFTIAPHFSSS